MKMNQARPREAASREIPIWQTCHNGHSSHGNLRLWQTCHHRKQAFRARGEDDERLWQVCHKLLRTSTKPRDKPPLGKPRTVSANLRQVKDRHAGHRGVLTLWQVCHKVMINPGRGVNRLVQTCNNLLKMTQASPSAGRYEARLLGKTCKKR